MTPIIIGHSEKAVLKEAEKYRLGRDDLCNDRLRKNKGVDFCLSCLATTLQQNTETAFPILQSLYGLTAGELEKVIGELIKAGSVDGYMDVKNKQFIHFSKDDLAQLMANLHSTGYLDLVELQSKLSVSLKSSIRIIIELIRLNKLRGTFNAKKSKYYLESGLNQFLLKEIESHGKVNHFEMAKKFDIPQGNIKNYLLNMMKNKLLQAYFVDNGKSTISIEGLEREIEAYSLKQGLFRINSLASHLKVAPELARRTLFGLIQKGTIRGIFTQNHEFITEDTLSEKIKAIARAYRTIPIRDLAKKLAITEQRVEEGLAVLISRGSVAGYIDMNKREFIADAKQPITKISSYPQGPSGAPSAHASTAALPPPGPSPQGNIEVVRQYDFVGGQLHFKVVVRNKSNMTIHDIKVILDVPSSYRRTQEMITISVIDPGNTHGVDFYLEPAECGISSLGGTVLYKDAMGQTKSIFIEKKDVQIKCPLVIKTLDTIEDCQKAIQSLPSDARAFLIADLPSQMAYSAAYRAVSQFDTRNVASLEDDKGDAYIAEAWFSSEAKVNGGRVITRVFMNGSTSSLEIRVWCNDAGQLTGFLAKIIELLFVEINMMRRIKAEERSKTLDVMAITRGIMEVEDMCMLRYKASSARIKLEDVHSRLIRMAGDFDEVSEKLYEWIKKLEADYPDEEDMLTDEHADDLEQDMQKIHQTLQIQLGG